MYKYVVIANFTYYTEDSGYALHFSLCVCVIIYSLQQPFQVGTIINQFYR